jgi:hypothetical protein
MGSPNQYARIDGRSAWHASTLDDPSTFTYRLPDGVLAAFADLAETEAFAKTGLKDITRDTFPLPSLEKIADLREELKSGRGFVVLSGLDPTAYSLEQLEKIYWILALYFGNPLSQSAVGDVMGYVQDETSADGVEPGRAYKARRVLPLHTDGGDLMGLFCVRTAASGGMSVITSVHSVFNDFVEQAPHLLPILERGFFYHRRGEQKDGQADITPYRVPALGRFNGTVLSHYVRSMIELAARDSASQLEPEEIEALDLFDRFASSKKNRLEFQMAPGDLFLANNYTTMHARTEFEDHLDPAAKRLILRIWLDATPAWNVPPQLLVFENDHGRGGIDPKVGGTRAAPKYMLQTAKPLPQD